MIFQVGIENNNEGYRSIAWALEHPGCFAYGTDSGYALSNLAAIITAYSTWITRHESTWIVTDKIELSIEDTWTDYDINESFDRVEKEGYTVEPFFQYDWKSLTTTDIERGLKLLAWSREDLLATISNLKPEQWAFKKEEERWDIAGIVRHIGNAEWWYLDRLGLAFPEEQLPSEPVERAVKVRARLNEVLPKLEGSKQVVGIDGELWSPRKVLRRALWHERDHIEHIRKLL
jgi:hypothetical protein